MICCLVCDQYLIELHIFLTSGTNVGGRSVHLLYVLLLEIVYIGGWIHFMGIH